MLQSVETRNGGCQQFEIQVWPLTAENLHFVIHRVSAIRIVGSILLCVDTGKDAFFVRTNK